MKRVISFFSGFILLFTIFLFVNQLLINFNSPFTFHPLLVIFIILCLFLTISYRKRQNVRLIWHLTGWSLIYLFVIIFSSLLIHEEKLIALSRVSDLIALNIFLAVIYFLTKSIIEVENQILNLDSAHLNPNTIIPFDKSEAIVQAEFIRANRYGHAITLLGILHTEESQEVQKRSFDFLKNKQDILTQKNYQTGKYISGNVRTSDQVIFDEKNKLFLLVCPELSRNKAGEFADRLKQKLFKEMNFEVKISHLTFPDDGLIFNALYNKLIEDLTKQPKEKIPEHTNIFAVK